MRAPILAFDMETIPDIEALRDCRDLSADIPDTEVVEMDARLRRQEKNTDFLPPHFHQIAVISCVMRYDDNLVPLKISSIGAPEYNEKDTVQTFFNIIKKYTPQLVSWNGGGFDLPVLHWRAMKYGIAAPRYWQMQGEDDFYDKFRWNNYVNRYHERHLDLMDVLGMYQTRAGLDDAARLCGLPGKIGIGGSGVWAAWQAGQIEDIRQYCETDALLTYLLFVRFQYFRGSLPSITEEYATVRECLEDPKWAEFLAQWRD